MRGGAEQIVFSQGEFFRLLRRARSLIEVEVVHSPHWIEKIGGEGAHWHYHEAMELTLFTAGEGSRFVGDHIGGFGSGDLVLLGQRLPHYWHTARNSSGYSVQWDFSAGDPVWALPELAPLTALKAGAARGLRLLGNTAAFVHTVFAGMLATAGPERLGLFLQLLGRLVGTPQEDAVALSGQAFELASVSSHSQAMAEAVLQLVSHFREELPLEDVLKRVGMSKPAFSRQFRRHSGRTFQEFLLDLRFQAACREQRHSLDPVTVVALRCGFSHIVFFNRVFRRSYGCSPSVFREDAAAL